MMNRIITILCLIITSYLCTSAQVYFGPKGGLSASWINIKRSIEHSGSNYTFESDKARFGIHVGVFSRIEIGGVFLQPEALFTHSEGKVKLNSGSAGNEVRTLTYDKFDFPVLLGGKFNDFFRIQTGPVFTLLLNGDARETDVYPYIKENYKSATIGYQVGIGVDIADKIVIDLKYEGDLSDFGKSIQIGGNEYKTAISNAQVILSIGYNLLPAD